MLQIYKDVELEIPEGVTVELHARDITVTGPRGVLKKVRIHWAGDILAIDRAPRRRRNTGREASGMLEVHVAQFPAGSSGEEIELMAGFPLPGVTWSDRHGRERQAA